MMSLLERAVAHYKGIASECIEVPEWGDESGPARIFYTVPTLQEVQRVRQEAKDRELEMAARMIVLKAKDEAGNNLFKLGDHMRLMRECHPEVVSRVSAEMTKGLHPPDPKDAEKN